MTAFLDVKELDVSYGSVEVLRGISLSVAEGALVAIVGANGAGKTTLLRTLSRLVPLRAGAIHFDGRSLDKLEPHVVTHLGLVHVPQGRQIIPSLTVEENLLIGASGMPGVGKQELAARLEAEFQRFPVLRDRRRLSGASLSGGEQQMLAVSRALMMKPRALLLDEPSLGLAPQIITAIFRALRQLADSGVAVLLVEQVAFTALKIADFGYVLQNGRIAMSGPPDQLLKDPELVSRYLG